MQDIAFLAFIYKQTNKNGYEKDHVFMLRLRPVLLYRVQ